MSRFHSRIRSFEPSAVIGVGLMLCAPATMLAAAPTLTGIAFIPGAGATFPVTLTGTGFKAGMTAASVPANLITVSDIKDVASDGTSAAATFKLAPSAGGTIRMTVTVDGETSAPYTFVPGVTSTCLDALPTGSCALRLDVIATSATGSSSQTANSTAANILAKLDYQFQSPKVQRKQGFWGRTVGHATFTTGLTQVATASKVQPASTTTASSSTTTLNTGASGTASSTTTTTSSTGATNSCPGGSSSTTPAGSVSATPATCTLATPQQAFVAEGAATFGWSFGRNGSGVFSEFGIGARGSLQDLTSQNQVIQNTGLTYINLSSNNPQNVISLYEGTAHFKVSQWKHDKAPTKGERGENVSNLFVIEGGFQNNSGLQQLITSSPQTNTRDRIVGRFSLTPELPGANHTTLTLGMEYSRGINGGPKIVQLFVGTNVNPAKLFAKNSGSN
jgi:hypothetical protein